MITKEQRQERKRFIGSSDIAALFTDPDGKSLDPFKTAFDIWASKVFEFEEEKTTESQSGGIRWEPYLIEWAENELGCSIETAPEMVRFICTEHPIFASNLDGYTSGNPPQIIECKKTRLSGEWGEPGTDQMPYRVILQVHMQMLCTGWNTAFVAAMICGEETLYTVERNEAIINAIIKRGEEFWEKYVITKTPPPNSEPGDISILKRIKRVPEKYADVNDNLFLVWDAAKQNRLRYEKEEETALKQILAPLGDAEGAKLLDGREFTYFKQHGADLIDRKAFKANYPEVYVAVTNENFYRVPRLSKARA